MAVLATHKKKSDALIISKWTHHGVSNNPNSIANLLNVELNEDEISFLKVGLKYVLLMRPHEDEKIVIIEDIYD